jgi:hypothetical protein
MVSVSERGLPGFEADESLKSYTTSNHMFADLFGGVRVRWPIVFFLSEDNPQGAHLQTVGNAASIISLGHPYSLMDVSLAIDSALAQQNIRLVRPWFLGSLARESGVDASQAYSLRGLVALPGQVVAFLADHQLRGSHTLLIHDDELRTLDQEAIAQALGFSSGEYAVLVSDARQTFQLTRNGVQESDFATPQDLSARLQEAKLSAVLGAAAANFGLWRQLPKDSFAATPTAVMLVSVGQSEEVARFEGFGGFSQLRLNGGLMPGVEQ